ncbi:MAG: LytTR family transcriptional regulator DNA-binding domain-containing protein [Bacteroidota bacterium]
MISNINQLNQLLKSNLKLALSISFGVFLFILFYQPFSVEKFDDTDWLIFVTGLTAIVFILIMLVRVGFPWFTNKNYEELQKPAFLYKIGGIILFVLNLISFLFYLHYLGSIEISLDLLTKVVFICLAPPVILWINDKYKRASLQNETLFNEKKLLEKQLEKHESAYQNTSIELASENSKEVFDISISNIAFIQSADNYVEVVYKEDGEFKKKLLRNTLKNIELQLKSFSNFVRCHRSFIVNTYLIETNKKDLNKMWLAIKGLGQKIPVSRQYLIKLKEAI